MTRKCYCCDTLADVEGVPNVGRSHARSKRLLQESTFAIQILIAIHIPPSVRHLSQICESSVRIIVTTPDVITRRSCTARSALFRGNIHSMNCSRR